MALGTALRSLSVAGLCLAPALFAVAAEPISALPAAIAGKGTPNLNLRLRYEHVDQDNFGHEADAFTARVRLGYTSGAWNGLDGQIEFEAVQIIGGQEDFNSTENGRTAFPVVADPDEDEINQAWIGYTGLPKTTLRYGRQRIVFDNQRFLGNVGFRQNEQTYDAFTLSTALLPRTAFDYAYIHRVNAFLFFDFDPSPDVTRLDNDLDLEAHHLHAAVKLIGERLTITPYALLLDFDRIPAPALARMDTRTLGLRVSGATALDAVNLTYTLEYADQQDYADAPASVDADYWLAEAGLAYGGLKATLSREAFSGDGSYSFQTPLATLYAFQGSADQFLVTPATGLRDLYLTLVAPLARATLTLAYHDFKSDRGSTDFGTEVDALLTYPLIRNLVLGAKFAAYSADEFPVSAATGETFDTTKSWLFLEYKF